MKRWLSRRRLLLVIILSCLVASGYYASKYRAEQQWLRNKARSIVEDAGARAADEQIVALRDYVRRHVRYEDAPHDDRPFLRAAAKETLESGLGFCGEAVRAFISLARHLGYPAQRVNLHGRLVHVVAEVQPASGKQYLVDVQENKETNAYLDAKNRTVDEVITDPKSPFNDYSNVNLRRLPVINLAVRRIRLQNNFFTWTLENPSLLKAIFWLALGAFLIGSWFIDRLLVRIYARRFGLRQLKESAKGSGPHAARSAWVKGDSKPQEPAVKPTRP